jgi:NAD(P)-dependent dehydrogenase (short-subunit alcohol dehydrogenase family)
VSSGPIALVTGASRELGRSTALRLAQGGVDIILTYKSSEAEAQEVVADIEALGRRAIALRLGGSAPHSNRQLNTRTGSA